MFNLFEFEYGYCVILLYFIQYSNLFQLKTSPQSRSKSDDKSHLYWAKGTGFGTGSTTQSWNVEQALSRQRSEEQHVTVLLQVIFQSTFQKIFNR